MTVTIRAIRVSALASAAFGLAACATPPAAGPSTPSPPSPPVASAPGADLDKARAALDAGEHLQAIEMPRSADTVVDGRASGGRKTAYALPAHAGQVIAVSIVPKSAARYFDIVDVGSGETVFRGRTDQAWCWWERAPNDVTLLIRPDLRGDAARGDYALQIVRR